MVLIVLVYDLLCHVYRVGKWGDLVCLRIRANLCSDIYFRKPFFFWGGGKGEGVRMGV